MYGGFYGNYRRNIAIPDNIKEEEINLKNIALTIAHSVLNLIQDKTSIDEEASILKISKEELATFHKCFIDGGIEAIKEKLKKKFQI